jgi:hypothetical protein
MTRSLPLTPGISNDRWMVLDALRMKPDQSDYTGVPSACGGRVVPEGPPTGTAEVSRYAIAPDSEGDRWPR